MSCRKYVDILCLFSDYLIRIKFTSSCVSGLKKMTPLKEANLRNLWHR